MNAKRFCEVCNKPISFFMIENPVTGKQMRKYSTRCGSHVEVPVSELLKYHAPKV